MIWDDIEPEFNMIMAAISEALFEAELLLMEAGA